MPDDPRANVEGQVDTWYAVFSDRLVEGAHRRWIDASTEPGCRHVYLLRAAPHGTLQLEATAFGAFNEYLPHSLSRVLLAAKKRGDTVIEWGIDWTPQRMSGILQAETLRLGGHGAQERQLPGLAAPVYIQPGYFSCVVLCKVFLNIDARHVQTPGELRDYLLECGAMRI